MADFFGKLKSGAGKVAFEADKMTRLNRAQGEVGQIKRQIESLYMKLGEMYYKQYANPVMESPNYTELCQNIADLEQKMAVKNEEVARINAETYNPQGAAPAAQAPVVTPTQTGPMGQMPVEPVNTAPASPAMPQNAVPAEAAAATKFCPNCGREMSAGVKFCPDCGTKVM